MTIKDRIAALRQEMAQNNIDAFIVFSADPHMSEYLPNAWKEREWISGFTGSAGFVVILKDKAGLWTDGRYFTQAPIELEGSGIYLFKDGMEGTPSYIDWIISETSDQAKVAVNALATSIGNWKDMEQAFSANNRVLVNQALLSNVWKDRGNAIENPIFVHPDEKAGQTVTSKLDAIRGKLKEKGATGHIINSLDDVAWTLNLRGSDVECNPVFLGYIYLTQENATLFVNSSQLEESAKEAMKQAGVEIKEYAELFPFLAQLKGETIWLANNCNQAVYQTLEANNQFVVAPVPGNLMKAIKNEAELAGFRSAMIKDGVAMVNFLHWLENTVGKEEINEYEIGVKLEGFRAQQKDFVGVSFDSIVGFQENGAIMHYRAPEEGSSQVKANGSILVDSGGQYLEGTTDITRTLPLGDTSDEFKKAYTLVLKGHIQLSMMKFPKGTRGVQLDTIARKALWLEGMDFNHGTGHGVGSFMNVHEGPQNIRKDLNPQILLPGMVLSNEPGYYEEGNFGIRIENLIAVKEWKTTEWNDFYEFETLTYCPINTELVVKELLLQEEIDWLNAYHKECSDKLLPYLEGDVKDWFLEQVKPL